MQNILKSLSKTLGKNLFRSCRTKHNLQKNAQGDPLCNSLSCQTKIVYHFFNEKQKTEPSLCAYSIFSYIKLFQKLPDVTKNTIHLHSWWENFHEEKLTKNLMHIVTDAKLRPTGYTRLLAIVF